MISLDCVASNNNEYAKNEEEAVDGAPPWECRQVVVYILNFGNDDRNEGNEPSQLRAKIVSA